MKICFIWIRFDNRRLGEKGSLQLLLEDFLIFKLCPMEESASHHVTGRRVLRTTSHRRCHWTHETLYNLISRSLVSQEFQGFHKIVADRHHLWWDSEPEVDTVGICVINHYTKCREFFIWMQFDLWNLDFRGSTPCYWRTLWFLNYVPWGRVLRTIGGPKFYSLAWAYHVGKTSANAWFWDSIFWLLETCFPGSPSSN